MGLDIIELFLAVEDTFQIHIENEEAERAVTVGGLHALILAKLRIQDPKRCLTSAAFYRTRRGIVEALGVDRRSIKPDTVLAAILPRRKRRATWRRAQAAMALKLPNLVHPGWMQVSLLAVGVAGAIAAGFWGGLGYWWIVPEFLLGLVVGGFLIKFSSVLAFAFPNGDATVGDLARDVLRANHAELLDDVGGSNEKDIWETLCRLIIEQAGVARAEITPDASSVDDLRMD